METNSQPEIIVEEDTFRALVRHVAHQYKAVDFLRAVPGQPSDLLQIAITFDDGWADNYDAVSMATAFHIPITIFICPALVGQTAPFWPERVMFALRNTEWPRTYSRIKSDIETLKTYSPKDREERILALAHSEFLAEPDSSVDRTLSWEEIQGLDRAGVHFGSHTMTHEILTGVPLDSMRDQLISSRDILEKKLGKRCLAFCYPNGNWSAETRGVVYEAGYMRAAIGEGRAWTRDCDLLAIPRFNVSQDNVSGPFGGFSKVMFEYTTIWKAWWATKAILVLNKTSDDGGTVALSQIS